MSHLFPARSQGDLQFGDILATAGIDASSVIAIRHTFNADGLTGPTDVTPANVLAYTRWQSFRRFPVNPPSHWLAFVTDGGLRSRFFGTFENRGELEADRTDKLRNFDLHPSDLLLSLRDRLVIEWSRDAVNWAKPGPSAARFRILEIADPAVVAFPGFDEVVVDFPTLLDVIENSRYRSWHTALASVQGIYLITDSRTGKHYVGKADGAERLLGRWTAYARTGHGGNIALIELAGLDPSHVADFRFAILRVFGPETPKAEVDAAEDHYKRALMTREFGYNRN